MLVNSPPSPIPKKKQVGEKKKLSPTPLDGEPRVIIFMSLPFLHWLTLYHIARPHAAAESVIKGKGFACSWIVSGKHGHLVKAVTARRTMLIVTSWHSCRTATHRGNSAGAYGLASYVERSPCMRLLLLTIGAGLLAHAVVIDRRVPMDLRPVAARTPRTVALNGTFRNSTESKAASLTYDIPLIAVNKDNQCGNEAEINRAYINIRLGTPAQVVSVIFDTGSTALYVPPKICSTPSHLKCMHDPVDCLPQCPIQSMLYKSALDTCVFGGYSATLSKTAMANLGPGPLALYSNFSVSNLSQMSDHAVKNGQPFMCGSPFPLDPTRCGFGLTYSLGNTEMVAEGYLVSDTLAINSLDVSQAMFGQITMMDRGIQVGPYAGIFGFSSEFFDCVGNMFCVPPGPGMDSATIQWQNSSMFTCSKTISRQLFEAHNMSHEFGLCFGQASAPGVLTLGGVNGKYFMRNFSYATISKFMGTYSLTVSQIGVILSDGRMLSKFIQVKRPTVEGTGNFNIDTGSCFLCFPSDIYHSYEANILPYLSCSSDADCGSLLFTLDGMVDPLPIPDMLVCKAGRCSFDLVSVQSCERFSLGVAAMRRFYLHFDLENSRVGFADLSLSTPCKASCDMHDVAEGCVVQAGCLWDSQQNACLPTNSELISPAGLMIIPFVSLFFITWIVHSIPRSLRCQLRQGYYIVLVFLCGVVMLYYIFTFQRRGFNRMCLAILKYINDLAPLIATVLMTECIEINLIGFTDSSKHTLLLLLASVPLACTIGTTTTTVFLMRPFLRANDRISMARFLIFLSVVANLSGAITPMGGGVIYIAVQNGMPVFWALSQLHFSGLWLFLLVLFIVAYFLSGGVIASTCRYLCNFVFDGCDIHWRGVRNGHIRGKLVVDGEYSFPLAIIQRRLEDDRNDESIFTHDEGNVREQDGNDCFDVDVVRDSTPASMIGVASAFDGINCSDQTALSWDEDIKVERHQALRRRCQCRVCSVKRDYCDSYENSYLLTQNCNVDEQLMELPGREPSTLAEPENFADDYENEREEEQSLLAEPWNEKLPSKCSDRSSLDFPLNSSELNWTRPTDFEGCINSIEVDIATVAAHDRRCKNRDRLNRYEKVTISYISS